LFVDHTAENIRKHCTSLRDKILDLSSCEAHLGGHLLGIGRVDAWQQKSTHEAPSSFQVLSREAVHLGNT